MLKGIMVSGAVGPALAVRNGICFLITVFAIQLTAWQWPDLGPRTAWLLAPGPVSGIVGNVDEPPRGSNLVSR